MIIKKLDYIFNKKRNKQHLAIYQNTDHGEDSNHGRSLQKQDRYRDTTDTVQLQCEIFHLHQIMDMQFFQFKLVFIHLECFQKLIGEFYYRYWVLIL